MNRTMVAIGFLWLLTGMVAFVFHGDHSHMPGMTHVHDLRLATGLIIANLWFIGAIIVYTRNGK